MNVYDLLVKISGNGQGLRDDIERDKESVHSLLDSIHNKDMKVEANVTEADAKLDAFKQRLKEIQETHALIKVDDDKAQSEVDKLKIKLDDIVYRALKITADDTDAEAKITDLHGKLAQIRADYTKLPIGVEDASALEKIDAIKMDLDTLHGKTVTVDVRQRGSATGGGQNRRMSRGALIAAWVAALAPAASPLGASLLGGAGGLASAATPGLVGAAGFAAVAKSNIHPVTQAVSTYNKYTKMAAQATTAKQQNADLAKANAAWVGLNKAQLSAAHSLQTFEGFWKKFAASFQNPVLTLFKSGLQTLKTLLLDIKPAISGTATAFNKLMSDAQKALNSPFWKQFFSWLGKNAKQSTMVFGKSLGNLTKGFAGLLMAFQPMAKEMDAGWLKMTASFAKWATSLKGTKNFENFLKYASKSGKAVLALIGNLAHLIGTLLRDFEPLGLAMVKFISDLAKWINQLLRVNPIISALVKNLLGVITSLLQGVDAIVKFMTWLRKAHPAISDIVTAIGLATAAFIGFNVVMNANPIAKVITIISLLVVAGTELVTHWKQIKHFFAGLWKWFATETKKVWDAIATYFTKQWKSITGGITKSWDAIVKFFKKYGLDVLAALTGPIGLLALYLVKHWSQISADAKKAWNGIKKFLHGLWTSTIKDAETIFSGLGKFFTGLWKTAESWGSGIVNGVWKGIKSAFAAVETKMKKIASEIGHFFGGGGSQVQVRSNVASMVQHVGTVNHVVSGSVSHAHTGTVDWGKPSAQSVKHIERQIYRNGLSRGMG